MGMAILAHVDRSAIDTVIVTASLVNRASLIGNLVFAHEIESTESEPTMATIIVHGTRNHNLG